MYQQGHTRASIPVTATLAPLQVAISQFVLPNALRFTCGPAKAGLPGATARYPPPR